jgi:hypothetical protein
MGHYDDCYESDEEDRRKEHERRVKSTYDTMLFEDDLTRDKLKDAILYLLESQRKHGSLPVEADIHIRRLRNSQGFER